MPSHRMGRTTEDIRRELGHQLKLRHVPELIFKATDSIEYSANISKILNDLKE